MPRNDYFRSALAGFAVEPLEPRQLLATFSVTTTADSGPGSLRQAVLDANAAAGADVIDFAGATFTTPQTITLASEIVVDEAGVGGASALSITGPAAQVTVSGNDASRIFFLAADETLTVSNLDLVDGRSNNGGGAIAADENSTLNLNGSAIRDSVADDGIGGDVRGGAIFSSGTVTLTNSDLTGNTSGNGGAIYAQPAAAATALNTISVTGGSISNNTTTGVGGGIFAFANIALNGATMNSNVGGNNTTGDQGGGAIYLVGTIPTTTLKSGGDGDSDGKITRVRPTAVPIGTFAPDTAIPNATLNVINSTISNNTAEGLIGSGGRALGGGIIAFDSTVNIIGSRLVGNQANALGSSGGALFYDGTALYIANSEIAGNSSITPGGPGANSDSGGILTQATGGITSNITVVNSTFSGNSSGNFNAALFASFDAGTDVNVVVTQSTFTQNAATTGDNGGINVFSASPGHIDFVIANSIVAGNTAAAGQDPDFINDSTGTSSVTSLGGNFVGPTAVDGNPSPQPQIVPLASDNVGSNPQLGALAFNGGPTRTHLPNAGSPVINDGVNANAADPGPDNILGNGDDVALTTDQRGPGFARIVGGTVDIGAAEVQGSDTDPPSVSATAFLFQTRQQVTFTFDEDMDPASFQVGDLQLVNDDTGASVPTPAPTTVSYNAGTRTVTFTFNPAGGATGTLPRGNYEAMLPAGSVSDLAGNGLAPAAKLEFFVTPGDANHDRTVDLADFGIVRTNFGQSGRTFGQGDFNYDGTVDLVDFGILRSNFGTTLAPPAPDGGDLFGGGDNDGDDFF